MLLDALGRPAPPSDIIRRLQSIDHELGMVHVPMGDGHAGVWGITKKWQLNDPRRAHIQRGDVEASEDRDIIVFLPADCPAEQAYGYFVSRVKVSNRDDVRAMLNRMHFWNDQQQERNWQPVMDEAMSQVESMAHGLVRAGSTAKRRKRGE